MMSANKEDLVELNALRVEALYSHSAVPVAVTLTGSLVLFFVLLNESNKTSAIIWLASLLTVSFLRYLLVRHYRHTQLRAEDYQRWLNYFLIGTIFSGLVLGSSSYVFITNDDVINIGLLTMFILVLASGSIGIYSAFSRVYYAYNLPAILPLLLFLFLHDHKQFNQLGIILFAFIVFIFVIQSHAAGILKRLISVQLDNKNLLSSYEVDQSRIDIMRRMYNTNLEELDRLKIELDACREKLAEK